MPHHTMSAPVPAALPRSPDNDSAPGPRSNKGQRTRDRLVEAAQEVFEEQGFLAARVTDIAKRAGQSHASFYYYFGSKELVFREVAMAVDARLAAPLHDVIMGKSGLAPQQRIAEALRRHFESYRTQARMLSLIEHVARFDATVSALLLARHKRYTEQIAHTIRELQRRGLADPTLDPQITATALGALTYRFMQLWLVNGDVDCSYADAVEQLALLFENSLGLQVA